MANAGRGATGALSGAAAGAGIGSVVPGIGTAIGGIAGGLLGGLGGLFGGGDDKQPANIVDPVTGQQLTDAAGNVQGGIAQQQAFVQALQAQNGIQNQSNVYNQLQGVANGTGPNPAQAQLAQATGANVANQAALMAGQRGASANAGLIARQAGQQGAATQQNAAGQAASLQAAQSLGALNQLGGIAGQQVNQQQNAITGLNQFAQSNQGQLLGAQTAYNNAAVGNANGAINVGQQQYDQNVTGGLLNGAAGVASAFGGASKKTPTPSSTSATTPAGVPSSQDWANFTGAPSAKMAEGGPVSAVARHFMAKGGKVPAMVSPGERYLSPKEVEKVAHGKKSAIKAGEKIPGKAKVSGAKDSYANDTVSKTLQSGGIVLPRHVTQAKDAPEKAAAFVRAVLAKQGLK